MINFKRVIGPAGIPIYYQQMPELVEAIALDWVIFTGSADDSIAGADGAYHWFEHVPFRGTKRFPGGYADIQGQLTRYCGSANAWTNTACTDYWTHVPLDQWQKGLDVVTDLWAQPLARDEDIEAERQIIFEEIRRKMATAQGKAGYLLNGVMLPGYPLGHPTLGSEESLKSITPAMLRKAHELGYDRSRVALFVSGNIPLDTIVTAVEKLLEIMPDRSLSERRGPVSRGAMPAWQAGKETVIETEFASTVMYTLFPVPTGATARERILWQFLGNLASLGGLNSPLYRIIREERKLAYATSLSQRITSDGGSWGFQIETGKENIELAKQAFRDLLTDEKLRSQERFDEVKEAIRYSDKMQKISAHDFNAQAISRLQNIGVVMNDDERNSIIEGITLEEARIAFDQMTPEVAHTVIFKGTGK